MMTTKKRTWLGAGALVLGATALATAAPQAGPATQTQTAQASDAKPTHKLPAAKHGGTVIGLCDGETHIEVQGTMTKDKAQAASDQLMAEWRKKHPEAHWDDALADNTPVPAGGNHTARTPPGAATTQGSAARPSGNGAQSSNGGPIGKTPATQHDVYGGYDARDEMVWAEETRKFIDEGNAIFHDAKKLGGTIAVSCDMCHPNAANTHPETYPKFQVQLGRVALLRDMINWCIENPVKGRPLKDDDRKLRALEAYIMSQRKGVPMNYGKH